MINNRQAGRRRGRGGQQQRSSGGNPGRQDSGNRIDNRARGNAAQLLEKYKTLARDAQMQGDRVNVEYYLQFADHYFRVLAETRARFEENGGAVSTRRIQGATLDEDEPDYEDEGERGEQPQPEQNRGDQNRGPREGQNREYQRDGQRDGQNRDGQQRGQQNGYRQDGRQDGRQDARPDGNRGYNQNGNAQRDQNGASDTRGDQQRGNGQDYDNRPRANGNVAEGGSERQADAPRDEQGERPPRRERYERTERVARPVEPVEQEAPVAVEGDVPPLAPEAAEPPRRGRGRPRREVAPVEAEAPGLENVGFMAERLPPSLNVSAAADTDSDGEEAAEKPRRRRGRPAASAATTAE